MNIGYIGLGALGGELAKRFLGHHELTVWDLNREAVQRFKALGAHPATCAADIAARCDVILTCLPRSSDVHDMIFGAKGLAGALRPGTLIIDQTSGIPEQTRAMAQRLAESNVRMMDAAVSASPHIVSQGLTTLMVSGTDEAYEQALPVLRTITQTIYRCGNRVGDGQAMKMVNNAMNGACRVGTLEVVALGRKLGYPLNVLTRTFNHGPAQNQTTDKMLPAIEQGKESTNFSLALMLKDVNQAVALGMSTRTPMPVSGITRALMLMGLNKQGPAARLEDMIGVIESMADTRIAPQDEAVPQANDDGLRALTRVGYLHAAATEPANALCDSIRNFAIDGDGIDSFARECEALLIDLNDQEADELFFGGPQLVNALQKGTLIVHLGTGEPARIQALQQALSERGMVVADAPMHPELAQAASASLPFGAAPEHAASVQALLAKLSSETVYCGDVGNGRTVAILRDAVTAMCLAIALECVMTGYKYGLALRDMATVLNRGSGWSAASRLLLGSLTEGHSLNSGSALQTIRSLNMAIRLAIQAGAPVMSLDAARMQFEAAANRPGQDIGGEALVQHFESTAQIRLS